LAASVVPRGLENDVLFHDALYKQLRTVVQKKLEEEILGSLNRDDLPAEVATAVERQVNLLTRRWGTTEMPAVVDMPDMSDEYKTIFLEKSDLIGSVVEALKSIVDYSVELRFRNQRISSELYRQPKPVDSIVDDFAVEAQSFANSLTLSTALAVGAIALRLVDATYANVVSSVLSVLSIGISFDTMTNVARYRNRNEEARILFFDTKLSKVMRGVFSLMSRDEQEGCPPCDNPFASDLKRLTDIFLENARYYNVPEEQMVAFRAANEHLMEYVNDEHRVLSFMHQLVETFIPDTFHKNSYLQEDLVNIYATLYDMLSLLNSKQTSSVPGAAKLHQRLLSFRPRLEQSLQRGNIKYGFLKQRKWHESPLFVTLRFLCGPACPTIKAQTFSILKEAESIMSKTGPKTKALRRETQDLKVLYYATRESEIASMVFLSVFFVFVTSIVFTIFRLVSFAGPRNPETGRSEVRWVNILLTATVWSSIFSLSGAILAAFHLARKLKYLVKLHASLAKRRKNPQIRLVRSATLWQEILTVFRLAANLFACVALPWSVVVQTFGTLLGLREPISLYVAAGSVLTAVAATLLFFFVEFVVRYNLPCCLGQAVCEPFQDRLWELKAAFDRRGGGAEFEDEETVERETWEYVARAFLSSDGYRFDTVFAADRFGSILQHIQSGNKENENANRENEHAGNKASFHF